MSSAAAGPGAGALDGDDLDLLDALEGTLSPDRHDSLAAELRAIQAEENLALEGYDYELLRELVETIERARLDVDEDELLDDPARHRRSTLPEGKIPTFGEPEEDCGEVVPEAMFWCPCCYDVKEFPHNCYRYDCPMHGLHAVRRRAAGQKPELDGAMPGIAAKLGALWAVLDSRRSKPQNYHHGSFNVPKDFFWRSDKPLERGRQLVRELLDVFGGQGLVAYHSYRTKAEDDRGEWKNLIGEDTEWRDVRKQLLPFGHYHTVCVADQGGFPGGAVTRALEAATGWLIKRHTARQSNVSVYGNPEMARAVTYTLSHAMIYDAGKQRRLAAWMKGPDVNDVEVYRRYWVEHRENVYQASRETLGLKPPNLECERTLVTRESTIGPAISPGSPSEVYSGASRSTQLPNSSNVDATGEVIVGSSGTVEATSDVPDAPGAARLSLRDPLPDGWPHEHPPGASSPVSGRPDHIVVTERCGGELRHISTAGEVLPELIDQEDADVSDLDSAYRSYVDVMRARGLSGDVDGRAEIPEFGDRPPPD